MLDVLIIDQILKRERERKKRRECNPEPLYLPIEAPRGQESPSEPEKIDIHGPEENDYDGVIVIQMYSYRPNKIYYQ